MSEQRKTYTAEFKIAAVKLITEQGYSFREAARSLGVSSTPQVETRPRRTGLPGLPRQGKLPPEQEEIRRLKEEVQRLRMERDILKKATAFFARESL